MRTTAAQNARMRPLTVASEIPIASCGEPIIQMFLGVPDLHSDRSRLRGSNAASHIQLFRTWSLTIVGYYEVVIRLFMSPCPHICHTANRRRKCFLPMDIHREATNIIVTRKVLK